MAVAVSKEDLLGMMRDRLAQTSPAPHDLNSLELVDVIRVLVERLEWYQRGEPRCRQYALAITKLEEATFWLEDRRRKTGGQA